MQGGSFFSHFLPFHQMLTGKQRIYNIDGKGDKGMKLKNLKLTLANVAPTTNTKYLSVNSTSVIYERDEENKLTQNICGFAVNCAARKGDELKVKLPVDVRQTIAEINNKLAETDATILVSFEGLDLKAYAMTPNGTLYSGVSAKAQSVKIEKIELEEPELDENIEL